MRENAENERKDWRRDYFARSEISAQRFIWVPLLTAILLAMLASFLFKAKRTESVIIYTSQDQEFAEPILNEFTKQTGIKVRAVYDSEAVKTVGLAQRLLAEANHPQCDVWWSNE